MESFCQAALKREGWGGLLSSPGRITPTKEFSAVKGPGLCICKNLSNLCLFLSYSFLL